MVLQRRCEIIEEGRATPPDRRYETQVAVSELRESPPRDRPDERRKARRAK